MPCRSSRWRVAAKPNPAPPITQPTPTPKPDKGISFDGKDLDTDKLRDKANHAAASLGKYLDKQDPKMRERFQRISDKVTAQLDKDKGRWREKLQAERQQLGPQIDHLRGELAQSGDATKDKLRAQLADLEKRSNLTDDKLAKLQSVGSDAWKNFKAQLKADEAKDKTPPVDEDDDAPTPTPKDH